MLTSSCPMWLQWIQAPTPGFLPHKGQALHFGAVVHVPGPLSLALGQIPAPGRSGCQGQHQEQETIAAGYRNLQGSTASCCPSTVRQCPCERRFPGLAAPHTGLPSLLRASPVPQMSLGHGSWGALGWEGGVIWGR